MLTPGKRVGAQCEGPMSSLFVSGKGRLLVRPWTRYELGQLARARSASHALVITFARAFVRVNLYALRT